MSTPFCRKSGPLEFTWDYCPTCDTMFVRCPACGNNCCNAAFGRVTKDGKPAQYGDAGAIPCDVCNLAYQFQHLAWKHKDHPEISDDEKLEKQKCADEAMDNLFTEGEAPAMGGDLS